MTLVTESSCPMFIDNIKFQKGNYELTLEPSSRGPYE